MRLRRPLFVSIVASAAILTPTAATWADSPPALVDIAYAIVNNSTTPAQPEATITGSNARSTSAVFEGDLFVSCDATTYSRVHKDATPHLTCQVRSSDTHTLSYKVYTGPSDTHTATATFNCEANETMTLTFTGGGTSITYSPSCGASTDDDTTDPT